MWQAPAEASRQLRRVFDVGWSQGSEHGLHGINSQSLLVPLGLGVGTGTPSPPPYHFSGVLMRLLGRSRERNAERRHCLLHGVKARLRIRIERLVKTLATEAGALCYL